MAEALGVRIVLVAAEKECDFYLGRKRGACEGFKQGNGRVTHLSQRDQTGCRWGLLE